MRRRVRGGFEPPAYIASLIGSINDGARAAQTGGLTMLAVAVYLVATVISTTDEVLLRGTFVQFSQIGVSVPVVASYALAPIVFLFLHVHTLIRYDMLAENLRLLDRELRTSLPREHDRERCRQLLANVEFVQYWGSRPGSHWHAGLYKVVVWVMLVAIPVLVFLATQISFLRYQNFLVTYVVHMGCLALDLAALVTFWYRQGRRKQDWRPAGRSRTLVLNAAPALALFTFAAVYLGIPPVESATAGRQVYGYLKDVYQARAEWWHALGQRNWAKLADASGRLTQSLQEYNPLDADLCMIANWGCRYLRLDHRLLVEEKPDGEVLFKLRTGDGDLKKLLVHMEALFVPGRNFRFADFARSEFYDADFHGTDLRRADLAGVRLQGANLALAVLQGANLAGAQLQGADLAGAQMQGAILEFTQLQGAHLWDVQLQGANLRHAQMQGADLWSAQMQGADLEFAQMQGAYLLDARLQGTKMGGADLRGANLGGAQMQGADLAFVQMQGADLRSSSLWKARLSNDTNLSLADLRWINFNQLSAEDLPEILRPLQRIPDEFRRRQGTVQLTEALTLKLPPDIWPPVHVGSGAPVLVSAIEHPYLVNLRHHLIIDDAVYDTALAGFLTDLSRNNSDVAQGVVRRTMLSWIAPLLNEFLRNEIGNGTLIERIITRKIIMSQFLSRLHQLHRTAEVERLLWPDLARRLLAAEKEGAFTLDLDEDDRKILEALAARAPAPPAAAPSAP